jgi:hypothetical protein
MHRITGVKATSLKFAGRRKGYFFIFQRIYELKYHSETHRLTSLLLKVNNSLQITISYPLMLSTVLLKCFSDMLLSVLFNCPG